jgi:hypothetical protein
MNFPRFLIVTASVAVVAAGAALPGTADITPASFSLTAGLLSISAPSANAVLGTATVSPTATTISGQLGVVTVTDNRDTTPWTVSVISSAFTPDAGPAVPATAVSYAAGTVTESNVVTTPIAALSLLGVTPVLSGAPGVSGVSAANWDPTITILVPGTYAAGNYTATITHSVI